MIKPTLIIYLWMLPMFLMIIIPTGWELFCMLYRAIERTSFVDSKGSLEITNIKEGEKSHPERRNESRVHIIAPKAIIVNKMHCYKTHISNVSNRGISFANLPAKMFEKGDENFKVIFRTRERDYSMIVEPKWTQTWEGINKAGAKITSIPRGWGKFVGDLCPPQKAIAA